MTSWVQENATETRLGKAYIGACVHFDISGDIFVLQLGANISQKQLTFLCSGRSYSLR